MENIRLESSQEGSVKRNLVLTVLLLSVVTTLLIGSSIGCSKKQEKYRSIELKLFIMAGTPAEREIQNGVIKVFEMKHPNIKIELDYLPPNVSYDQKLVTMIVGGVAPDVFNAFPLSFSAYFQKGAFANLQPFIENDTGFDLNDFYPSLLKPFIIGKDVYALPLEPGAYFLFYNKTMFDIAELSYPDESWTWDTFLNAAKKLTGDIDAHGRTDQFGFLLDNWYWWQWVWQNGGDILNNEGTECVLDSPEAIEAIQFYFDLRNKHHVSPAFSQSGDVGYYEMFEMGHIGMLFSSLGIMPAFKETINDFEWGIAPPPYKKQRATLISPGAYAVSGQSKHKAEAWELVKHLTSLESQRQYVDEGLLVPSRKSAMKHFFESSSPPHNKQITVDVLEYGRIPSYPNWMELKAIIDTEIDLVSLNKKTAAEACKSLKLKVDKFLKKN